METTSQELAVYSSTKKLPTFESFETASSSKNTTYGRSRLLRKSLQGLANEHDQNFPNKHLKDSVASGPNKASQKLLVNCSRSNLCSYSHKGKEILQAKGVEELNERLKILEIETEAMKQAFIETIEERKRLVNEIYQDFLKIDYCRRHGNQVTGFKFWDRSLTVNSSDEGLMGTGLSQVLCEDSNPCIVTRDHRTKLHFS